MSVKFGNPCAFSPPLLTPAHRASNLLPNPAEARSDASERFVPGSLEPLEPWPALASLASWRRRGLAEPLEFSSRIRSRWG